MLRGSGNKAGALSFTNMKIFIAAFAHECNSFSPIPTSLRNFEQGVWFDPQKESGKDITEVFVGYSDFARFAQQRGHELSNSLVAWAQPSAPLNRADYEGIRDRILSDLQAAMPVDAILLMLHGAQMAQGYDDCEGDLLKRIRALVGVDIPIGVELDLHCNITEAMLQHASVIVACKEYPHTDFPERALELFNIIEATAKGETNPVMALHRVPVLTRFHTSYGAMRQFVDKIIQMEGKEDILSISLAHGFPWSDTGDTGASVLVVSGNKPEKAKSVSAELAQEFFSLRKGVVDNLINIETAIDNIHSLHFGPLVIADVADNPGGGAAGDSTFILRALLENNIKDAAVAMIWDPIAVQTATDAGVDAKISMRIGGKMSPRSGEPLDVEARVMALAKNPGQRSLDTRVIDPLGPSAAVQVCGVTIVLNSIRQQTFSPDCFTQLGIEPESMRVLVVKSSQHFYAQFQSLAKEIVYCDTPGTLSSDLAALPYKKLQRPVWPLDNIESIA